MRRLDTHGLSGYVPQTPELLEKTLEEFVQVSRAARQTVAACADLDFVLLQTAKELQKWEDIFDAAQAAKFGRVALGALQKKQKLGQVLAYTSKALDDATAGDLEAELRKAKTQAMEALGWDWLVAEQKMWEKINAPKSFALF